MTETTLSRMVWPLYLVVMAFTIGGWSWFGYQENGISGAIVTAVLMLTFGYFGTKMFQYNGWLPS